MLPLECCTGLLLACREGVFSWQCGSAMAMRQREGKTQWQVPTNPPPLCLLPPFFQLPPTAHVLRKQGAACVSGRVDAVRSGASQVPDVRTEVHRYVPALLSPFPHFRQHHFILEQVFA
ncbi:hypothetical protein B0H10DRAFT_2131661, partial [Mycena sp. CBHHK59/15]